MWGDRYYTGGDYHPRHLEKLANALPKMRGLTQFHINCPFYPPSSIFNALIQCPSIRSLSMADTPLYNVGVFSKVPSDFHLENISIVPVAEALRVGEGPFDSKYTEISYYTRDYRRKYKNDSLARYAADAFLFTLGKASSLQSVQISGDLCDFATLANHDWPNLRSLILTGHVPRQSGVELIDVIAKMPALVDLRLLFAATFKHDPLFHIIPSGAVSASDPTHVTARNNPATLLSQIRYLAISNACRLTGAIFHYANQLERLVICAISDLPRVPVALGRADIDALMSNPLADAAFSSNSPSGGAGSTSDATPYHSLKLLRIMIEDKVNPELCHRICRLFPNLESLEVELCGYHDGKSIYAWDEFASAFTPLTQLRKLRLCIQFPEFDEADRVEPWRNARRECAAFFAGRLPKLEYVGFEYRKRTGTHRYEDSWLEFQVERLPREGAGLEVGSGSGSVVVASSASGYVPYHIHATHGDQHPFSGVYRGSSEVALSTGSDVMRLEELPASWYRFPEVWTPEYLPAKSTP